MAETYRSATQPWSSLPTRATGVVVNDIHSQLNPTRVDRIVEVEGVQDIARAISEAARDARPVCVAGGRHAMGGQQFVEGGVLIDTRRMSRVLDLDAERGIVEVEAGAHWPELIRDLAERQRDVAPHRQWGIIQKQTGADRLSMGGALAANAHGRGLRLAPFIGDVEAFTIVGADGIARRCSRRENRELFSLAAGGYGLFGVVVSIALRLARRVKLRRDVEIISLEDLATAFEDRIAKGYLYGDFQFAIDPASDDFLERGVFSTYLPVDPATPVPDDQKELSDDEWRELLRLAHVDKSSAFRLYCAHYLATSGQTYWSDTHQLSTYLDDYHRVLDEAAGAGCRATEIISELYVPRELLVDFMRAAASDFRANAVDVIYGTVRLIERDTETFLPWARDRYACIIFNLHTDHSLRSLERTAEAFRRLIDLARARNGSYFLTYHRYATREQVEACHPNFPRFLQLKREHDPEGRFQSDWYRHHARLFDAP